MSLVNTYLLSHWSHRAVQSTLFSPYKRDFERACRGFFFKKKWFQISLSVVFWLPSVIQQFRFPPLSYSYCSKLNCLLSVFVYIISVIMPVDIKIEMRNEISTGNHSRTCALSLTNPYPIISASTVSFPSSPFFHPWVMTPHNSFSNYVGYEKKQTLLRFITLTFSKFLAPFLTSFFASPMDQKSVTESVLYF